MATKKRRSFKNFKDAGGKKGVTGGGSYGGSYRGWPTAEQLRLYKSLTGPVRYKQDLAARYNQLREENLILREQLGSALAALNRRANVTQLVSAHDAVLAALEGAVARLQVAVVGLGGEKESR